MNVVEKLAVKLAWKRVEGKMGEKFKRWVPLIGSAILVAATVLRALGQTEAASVVDGIAGATGLTAQSPVTPGELIAAAGALMGLFLKLKSTVDKARAETPTPR